MNQYANDFTNTVRIYYEDLKRTKPLPRLKEKKLIRLSKKGNIKARNEILEANLKFVFDVAKKYSGRGVPISELISEGNMGLIKAIDKFDETKDVKFISYAVWWIRHEMLEIIKKNKVSENLEIEQGESNDKVFENMMDDEEDEIITASDTSYSNANDEKIIEIQANQKSVVNLIMRTLDNRETKVMNQYFGLNGEKKLTLVEIGEEMNISSERVRQIKLNAIRKMRSSAMLMDDDEDLFT